MAQLEGTQSNQAHTDAQFLLDKSAKGGNPDCVFSTWNHNRQMEAWRELKTMKDGNGQPAADDFTISFSDGGTHLLKRGDSKNPQTCSASDVSGYPLPKVDLNAAHPDTRRGQDHDTWKSYERVKGQSAPELARMEQERFSHPEVPAQKIEALANKALSTSPDSERAKLDLRQAMANLMGEPNAEFRNKVLAKLVDDGTYATIHPFNGYPHVEVTKGPGGEPETVTFSHNLGLDKQEIPLNKSLEQQVEEAQTNYVRALKSVTGGLGKFDPDATMKAYDILNGAEPEKLRWFMLYRKDQGRQPIDQDKLPQS